MSLYLRTAIAKARLAELPGADHFAFATRSELGNALIETFVTAPWLSGQLRSRRGPPQLAAFSTTEPRAQAIRVSQLLRRA